MPAGKKLKKQGWPNNHSKNCVKRLHAHKSGASQVRGFLLRWKGTTWAMRDVPYSSWQTHSTARYNAFCQQSIWYHEIILRRFCQIHRYCSLVGLPAALRTESHSARVRTAFLPDRLPIISK